MPFELRAPAAGEAGLRRELYFLSLFRVFESGLLTFVVFSPLALGVVALRNVAWAYSAAIAFLVLSATLFVIARNVRYSLRELVAAGMALDLCAFAILLHNLTGFSNGIGLLLLFNVGADALLLSLRWSLIFASAAALLQVGDYVLVQLTSQDSPPLPEAVMFGVSYLAAAMLTHLLGRQLREVEELAEQRGAEVDNLARVNEMIIRRMRTGLLAVDADNFIRLFNESAWYLLGNPSPERRGLADVSLELARRLRHWREHQDAVSVPLILSPDAPTVIPRFTALGGVDELTLIFLDDTSLLSRRAEELTLSTLGRLSASIAHEIRNPLAAISHAAQLLQESQIEPETDHRLVEIINSQCQRMDGIVQNVLGLARRERSRPESLELVAWVERFITEFRMAVPGDHDELRLSAPQGDLRATMDPQHLQQVLTVLLQNALTYGRMPGEPARLTVVVHRDSNESDPQVDVVDRGPGIAQAVAERLFQPFFTTSEHGTGLGLYIARELCEANQASLNYIPLPGGGSCFRITLTRTDPVMQGSMRA